jgi:hypothetical protein
MNKNLSHNIKASDLVVLEFTYLAAKGKPEIQVHATGCAHATKAERVVVASTPRKQFTDGILVDDYYYVAPCGRRDW